MDTIISCLFFSFFFVNVSTREDVPCGCKEMRECYLTMLNELLDMDEEACIEDAAIGSSTVTVFLKALQTYCSDVVKVTGDDLTYEGGTLYEVEINMAKDGDNTGVPVIIIEAGQNAGTEPVGFALYIIEQLVACHENEQMIKNVKWVILPSTNPDGQEYGRYSETKWRKNLRQLEDQPTRGVDISRNFDYQWGACPSVQSGFSQIYPGIKANSENETKFITDILDKYKKEVKLYLSIKRDGHHILYPYAYSKKRPADLDSAIKVAGEVATRINQRSVSFNVFNNMSLYEFEGKPHCGHSVDYAFEMDIPFTFEMRVFLGSDYKIISKFQAMPRNFESSLRNGYLSGIKELYTAVINLKPAKKRM